jgi:hypothetical protein
VVTCLGTALAFATILTSADYLKLWRHLARHFFQRRVPARSQLFRCRDHHQAIDPYLVAGRGVAVLSCLPAVAQSRSRRYLKPALLAVSGASLAFCLWQTQYHPVAAFYLPFSRIGIAGRRAAGPLSASIRALE